MQIKEILKKYWKEIKIKKWEYLFKNNEDDKNLYFIIEWEVLLTINWSDIAITWANEIIWEKSFLSNSPKPIDAKVVKDTRYYTIKQDIFNNLDSNEQIDLLKQLTLFISDRVYLLNDIINNLSNISNKISNNTIDLSIENIWKIFENIIKLENISIYKNITWWIIPIYESKMNIDFIQDNLENIKNQKITQIDNKILINTNNYVFMIEWEKLKNDYIINNVFMHSLSNFNYLWLLLEEKNNKNLEWFLEEDVE